MNGDYIFKIMFHSYANPDNLKANGSPCDGEQKCESFLHYCLEGSTSCSQESYQNYNITGGDPSPNPVLFPMSGSWPVSTIGTLLTKTCLSFFTGTI